MKDNNMKDNKFKIGDKVVCINNSSASKLKIGNIYTVESASYLSYYIKLENDTNYYDSNRFMPMKFETPNTTQISVGSSFPGEFSHILNEKI